MIDLAASHRHYLDHLLPVWRALPREARGDVYLAAPLLSAVPGALPLGRLGESGRLVLVAGFDDLRRVDGHAVLMEHGAGQSYAGDPDHRAAAASPAYAGGDGRHGVVAFLCPNEYAAERNRAANPDALVVVVGSPLLAALQALPAAPPADRPVVAFGFHWPCPVAPEAGYGWPHWRAALEKLAAAGDFELLGHAHPRVWNDLEPAYRDLGIEPVRDFEDVLVRAHVYCCDNSSTLFEWAALRGPTVVLDWPECRPWVHHGLRWWDAADVGPRILERAALAPAIRSALNVSPWPGAEERIARVFPGVEDPAGRAAEVILGVLGRPRPAARKAARFPRSAPLPG